MRNPFEIAKRFRYVGDADERIGELAHQLGKARDLMPVDYADEQTLFLVRKAACCGKNGYAVHQFVQQALRDFLAARGDDFRANGAFAALENAVADMRGDVAVNDAEDNGLDVEIVNEIRKDRNGRVEREDDFHHRKFGMMLVDVCGDEVRAAGAAAVPDGNAVNKAVNYARGDGGKQRAAAVAGMIDEAREVDALLQEKQHERERQRKKQRLERELLFHQEKACDSQRQVDQ